MKIGQEVLTKTENLFAPYVLGVNEKGNMLELPLNMKGIVGSIIEKNKTGFTVGVDFKVRDSLGKEQEVRIFFKPRSIGKVFIQ